MPIVTPTAPLSGAAIYHTVSKGETFYRISKMYHVSVTELMRANQASDPSSLEVGQRLIIPGYASRPTTAVEIPGATTLSQIQDIVKQAPKIYEWKTITVHHSGTLQGSARLFDRDHRRRHMGGLFYHFVIGNGSHSNDGQLEVGWRWLKQVKANRPNDIQICLVGDFDRQKVSGAQMTTLVNLIATLRKEYGISLNDIRKHCDIKGKHTDCPGKHFPFDQLLQELAKN